MAPGNRSASGASGYGLTKGMAPSINLTPFNNLANYANICLEAMKPLAVLALPLPPGYPDLGIDGSSWPT